MGIHHERHLLREERPSRDGTPGTLPTQSKKRGLNKASLQDEAQHPTRQAYTSRRSC